MNKKYLVGATAALLLGVYIFYILNVTVRSPHDMGNMAMGDSPSMNADSAGGVREAYRTAIGIMMEGIMRPATGYPDVDFVKSMIPHHEGAVAMAQIEERSGKDQVLKDIAAGLIESQAAEVAILKAWLSRQDVSGMQVIPEAIKANYASMLSMMNGMQVSLSGNADVDFAKTMILLHQGEIEMAKVVLQFGKDTQIRKLAQDTLLVREAEISSLKDWLAKAAN